MECPNHLPELTWTTKHCWSPKGRPSMLGRAGSRTVKGLYQDLTLVKRTCSGRHRACPVYVRHAGNPVWAASRAIWARHPGREPSQSTAQYRTPKQAI